MLARSMEEKQASLSGAAGRSYAPLKLLNKQDTMVRTALRRLDGAAQHYSRPARADPAADIRAWFATRGAHMVDACVEELLRGPAEEDSALERGEARAKAFVHGSAPEWFPAAVLAEESALVEELLAGVVRARMPEVRVRNAEKVAAVDDRITSSVALFSAELDRLPTHGPAETARLSEEEMEAMMCGFREAVAIEPRCEELRITLGRSTAAFCEGRIRAWVHQGVESAAAAFDASAAALPVMAEAAFSTALGEKLGASVGRFEKELEAAGVSGVVANESVAALSGALKERVAGHQERNRKVSSPKLCSNARGSHEQSRAREADGT